MDFKICGTRNGITGFQLDLKIQGLNHEIAKEAIALATETRYKILDIMEATLEKPREEVNQFAPRVHSLMIDPEKIGLLIGPGGKNIRRITETTGASIDIDEDNSGRVSIYASTKESMDRAIYEVELITGDIEDGKIYRGIVRSIKEFGAFVECLPGKEGLVHISELADFRVRKVEDVCKVGDEMIVKCLSTDEKGRVRLSRRAAMAELEQSRQQQEESGAEAEGAEAEEAADDES
jgi:polyribonucleotide nucleotidyltransferase